MVDIFIPILTGLVIVRFCNNSCDYATKRVVLFAGDDSLRQAGDDSLRQAGDVRLEGFFVHGYWYWLLGIIPGDYSPGHAETLALNSAVQFTTALLVYMTPKYVVYYGTTSVHDTEVCS